MLTYLITYITSKKELKQRLVTTLTYRVGDYTRSGWYVSDIQVFYKGRFYEINKFWSMFNDDLEKQKEKDIRETEKKKIRNNRIMNVEKRVNRFFKL